MLQQFSGNAFLEGNAQLVLSSKLGGGVLGELSELAGGNAADGALGRSLFAFIDVTANGANEFLLHNVLLFSVLC